ncbi:MAG TPA: hypothetical protein ENK62_02580 [Chromatiales bacterium]|nr:hypothetical protein [Chromatiales bacterium]
MRIDGNEAVTLAQREDAARHSFERGKALAEAGDWRGALECFQTATYKLPSSHYLYPFYLSCEGLAMVHLNAPGGLDLCRRAAAMADAGPDVFENLARAELASNHRWAALLAIRAGLNIDDSHEGLVALRRAIGIRRPPPLRFLRRDHLLNRVIGRLTYKAFHSTGD